MILSGALILKQKRELAGEESEKINNKHTEINLRKINVFKWTMDQEYRRSYIKRINEKL